MSGQELFGAFIGGLVVAVAGAIVLGIQAWLKKRVKMTGPAAEVAQIRPIVVMLLANHKPELIALKAILEALEEKMNGQFKRAHDGITKALDRYDKTVMDMLKGGEAG